MLSDVLDFFLTIEWKTGRWKRKSWAEPSSCCCNSSTTTFIKVMENFWFLEGLPRIFLFRYPRCLKWLASTMNFFTFLFSFVEAFPSRFKRLNSAFFYSSNRLRKKKSTRRIFQDLFYRLFISKFSFCWQRILHEWWRKSLFALFVRLFAYGIEPCSDTSWNDETDNRLILKGHHLSPNSHQPPPQQALLNKIKFTLRVANDS